MRTLRKMMKVSGTKTEENGEGTRPWVAVQKAHCPWLNEWPRQEVQRDAKLHRAPVEDKNSRTDFGKLFSNN